MSLIKSRVCKKEIAQYFYNTILVAVLVITGYIFLRSIFRINSVSKTLNIYSQMDYSPSDLKPLVILLGMVVYVVAVYRFYAYMSKKDLNDKKTIRIGIMLAVGYFIALQVYTNFFTINAKYDLSHIIREIQSMVYEGTDVSNLVYFQRYPNNIAITIVLCWIFQVANWLGITELNLVGNIIGCVSIVTTAWLCFLIVKKIKGNSAAILTMSIFVTNPLFYLYASYYYTDVISMPFTMLTIYLWVISLSAEQRSLKSKRILLASGVVLYFGIQIRATTIILLIAFAMYAIMQYEYKSSMKYIGWIIVGALCGMLLYQMIGYKNIKEENRSVEFPLTHWIMMGLNETNQGKYYQSDFRYTQSFSTYEEKKEKNIEEIKKRLSSMGPYGLIEHTKEKLAIVWSDGFGVPSNFVGQEQYGKVYDYSIGSKSIFVRYFSQICRSVLLFFIILYSMQSLCRQKGEYDFLVIAMLGAYAFYVLWEANERYSFSFLPWMIILMVNGVKSTYSIKHLQSLGKVSSLSNGNGVVVKKIRKYMSYGIILFTLMLIMVNKSTYSEEKNAYTDLVFVRASNNFYPEAIEIGSKTVEQSFQPKASFNQVELYFDTSGVKNKTNYVFEIVDKTNKVITKEKFSSNELSENKSKVFVFDTISMKKDSIYKLRIYSTNASSQDTLKLRSNRYYDRSLNCELLVNQKRINNNLNFSVTRYAERTYMSNRIYLFLSLLILILEVVILCPMQGAFIKFRDTVGW